MEARVDTGIARRSTPPPLEKKGGGSTSNEAGGGGGGGGSSSGGGSGGGGGGGALNGQPNAAPNLHLAQVLHSLSWAMLKDQDPSEAATIEAHFKRAIQLRRDAADPLAAESLNGLGYFYHTQARPRAMSERRDASRAARAATALACQPRPP